MKYQLVLQHSGVTLDDFDRLIEAEDELDDILGDTTEVDGHDFGSGEMNIFIFTYDPKTTFETIRSYLDRNGFLSSLKAAYRDIESDKYKALWPEDLTHFEIK